MKEEFGILKSIKIGSQSNKPNELVKIPKLL
jgi:hypothetical protein